MTAKRQSSVTIQLTDDTIKRAVDRVIETNFAITTMAAAARHLMAIGAEEYIDHE